MSVLVYFLIIISSVSQSASNKKFTQVSNSGVVFNAIKATVSAILLLAIALAWGFTPHLPTVFYGIGYGCLLSLSMFCGYKALELGPLSITSMLVAFSLILPLLYGVLFCGESLNLLKYIAFALVFIAIILANADKFAQKGKKTENYFLWVLFVLITFTSNGTFAIVQKIHQIEYPSLYTREFTFYAMSVCMLVYLTVGLIRTPIKKWREVPGKRYGVICGVTTGLSSLFTIILTGMENASVLFPIVSVGTILGVLLCGRVIFREKLKINHYIAFAVGATAVLFLKL